MRLSRLPPTEDTGEVTHASGLEDTSRALYTATYSGRPRRWYKVYRRTGVTTRHEHYHEATIITVARLTVINHATGMIRLNCCSHVSALEALPCRSLHGRAKAMPAAVPRAGPGGENRGRGEGARPFPTTWTSRTVAAAREAMSVTSGNYARVPVAIGLLILLGARWVRSLLAPRTRSRTARPGVRRGW